MLDAVHRQQELRRRILHAAYAALLEDPDGFLDAVSLDGDAPEGEAARAESFASLEARAAVYYLVERGLLFMMPPQALARHGLGENDCYVRITAQGIEAFESLVLSAEQEPSSRPIGFRIGLSSPSDARPTRAVPWAAVEGDSEGSERE